MTISIWIGFVIAVVALMTGFWTGRSIKWMVDESEEQTEEQQDSSWQRERSERRNNAWREASAQRVHSVRYSAKSDVKRICTDRVIGSPAAGQVSAFSEGNRYGASVQPDNGKVYAPVSGRIKKLYPMGSAMLITMDGGQELLLKVGDGGDELCSMYYRARVLQNEIVGKGKLLLEFDKEALVRQGQDVAVSVSVETGEDGRNVEITQQSEIRPGEDLLWLA